MNIEYRMQKGSTYFDIRHSVFIIRYSKKMIFLLNILPFYHSDVFLS